MTDRDPFRIEPPAVISVSGGRSSGYMLWRILQAHGGTLPADVRACFANTGKEMPQTLDFVRDCGERWCVDIVWLEYRRADRLADRWCRVNYETASRNGEPFAALIESRNFLPNPATRLCTDELKIKTMDRWAAMRGFEHPNHVIGLRFDEPLRVARMRARNAAGADSLRLMPLNEAHIVKADVGAFWQQQNFDLALPSINGTTPLGNCDLCFLKSAATISGIMRDMPNRAAWWIEAEAAGRRFRSDRPSYAAMFKAVQDQVPFDFGNIDEINDCFCGDRG